MEREELKRAEKFGNIIQIVSTYHAPLGGARVKVKRASKKTSNVTVVLQEDRGGTWVAGTELHVHQYELTQMKRRRDELEQALKRAYSKTMGDLLEMVQRGRDAREELVAKILPPNDGDYSIERLAYEASWGRGVKEDLKAGCAKHILSELETGKNDMLVVLRQFRDDWTRNLVSCRHSPTSSGAFANAVSILRNEVESSMVEFLKFRIEYIEEAQKEFNETQS